MSILSSSMIKTILLVLTLVTLQVVAHPADQSERNIQQGQGGASSKIQEANLAKNIVNRYEQCLKGISERQELARLQRRQRVQEDHQKIANLTRIVQQKQTQCLEEHNVAAQSRQHHAEFDSNLERAAEEVMSARTSRRIQLKASLAIDLSKVENKIKTAEVNSKINRLKAQKQQLTVSTLELQERINKMINNSLESLERKVEEQDQETRILQQKMKAAVLETDTNLRYKQQIQTIPIAKPVTEAANDDQHEDSPAEPARAASPSPKQNIPAQQEPAGQPSQQQHKTRKSSTIQEGDTGPKKKQTQPAGTKTMTTVPVVIPPSQPKTHNSPPPEKKEAILPTSPSETAPLEPSQLSPREGPPSSPKAHLFPSKEPIVNTTRTERQPADTTKTKEPIVDATNKKSKIVNTTEPKQKIVDTTQLPPATKDSEQIVPKEPRAGQAVPQDHHPKQLEQASSTQAATNSIKSLLQSILSRIKAIEVSGNYSKTDCAELRGRIVDLNQAKRIMNKSQRDQFAFVSAVNEINCEDDYQGKQVREMDLRLKVNHKFQSLEHNHNQRLLDLLGKIQNKHPKPSKGMVNKLNKLRTMCQESCRVFVSSLQESIKRLIANKRGQKRNADQCSQMKQLLMTLEARTKFMSGDYRETYIQLRNQYQIGCASPKPPKPSDTAH